MVPSSKRVVAITGASSGVGARMAHACAERGFDLVLCGRDRARLDGTKDAIEASTASRCALVAADLNESAGLGVFAQALQAHRVDTVINNAAVNPELMQRESLSSLGQIAEVINTNTSAAIAVALAAFEHFVAYGGGMIVNINSVAGLRGSGHEPVYAASKFGLRGFSESVKDAWFGRGVRMMDVYVGAIATGMSIGRPDVAELIDPDELAALVIRLCETHSFHTREINIQKTIPATRRTSRVVFANGVFDLLHPGHIALLQFARSLGDKLVVGLNSDHSVRELKGAERPIQDQNARKLVLEALRFVDEVVIFDELRTGKIVRKLMPDVIVKGEEYSPDVIRATDGIPDAVEIVTFPVMRDTHGRKLSTTATIETLRSDR